MDIIVATDDLKQAQESADSHKRPQHPHVLVIMADDVGWDDVGYHGSTGILTPNIDVLAADGVIINDYYTSQLCTPSRSAFLSGVHPINSGDQHYVITTGEPRAFSLSHPLIPQVLKRVANYSTHLIGKWGIGFYKQIYTPLYRGFDSFYGFYGNKIDYFTHEGESLGRVGLDWHNNLIPAPQDKGQYATKLLTDRTINIIKKHSSTPETPLFMQICFPNTHIANSKDPFQAGDEDIRKLRPMINDTNQLIYAANLFGLDESIGSIVKTLHETRLINDTIIIFISDNGAGGNGKGVMANFGSNFPLRGAKATLWEGGVRVPSFIWSPLLKSPAGTIFNGLFHVTDWLPTIVSAVQSTDPSGTRNISSSEEPVLTPEESKSLYGVSMWSKIQEGSSSSRKIILHNIDPVDEVSAIRVGNFKLLRGNFNRNIDGWFGVRQAVDDKYIHSLGIQNHNLFIQALREVSVTRSVLNAMIRKPNYDAFELTKLSCNFSNNSLCNPNIEDCLFDIVNDPCEIHNLAKFEIYQSLIKQMKLLMKEYSRESLEPQSLPFDPLSDPILHGNSWIPWRDSIYGFTLTSSSSSSASASFTSLTGISRAFNSTVCTNNISFTMLILQLMTSFMSFYFLQQLTVS